MSDATTSPTAEMSKAVMCLTLMVPEDVHDDVQTKWTAVVEEITRLRLALEVAGDFACFDPWPDDPCECCLHVTEIVNGALGVPAGGAA
jgi:hypothetical protein